jgi:phosphatidate phosphatase APP1
MIAQQAENNKFTWAIISDIDDTILQTCTSSLVLFLVNTFIKHPENVNGMPKIYNYTKRKLRNPRFWYISASPFNLFPYLRSPYNMNAYPRGDIILPTCSQVMWWFLASKQIEKYKISRIESVHIYNSQNKVVCIGDSMQKDPEVYGEIFRRYPRWVRAIFIRVAGNESCYKNSLERFKKAFIDVPDVIWYIFREPQELYEKIDSLY